MGLSVASDVTGTGDRRRVDRERGLLIGSRCRACGATSWPPRALCHRCGQPVEIESPLAAQGTLLSFTQVWVSRPGLETPYTLGQIEIEDAIFFGHVRELPDDAHVPLPVRVVIPTTANGPISFWFEPIET
jgi:uncharacterized OB-fold protein